MANQTESEVDTALTSLDRLDTYLNILLIIVTKSKRVDFH